MNNEQRAYLRNILPPAPPVSGVEYGRFAIVPGGSGLAKAFNLGSIGKLQLSLVPMEAATTAVWSTPVAAKKSGAQVTSVIAAESAKSTVGIDDCINTSEPLDFVGQVPESERRHYSGTCLPIVESAQPRSNNAIRLAIIDTDCDPGQGLAETAQMGGFVVQRVGLPPECGESLSVLPPNGALGHGVQVAATALRVQSTMPDDDFALPLEVCLFQPPVIDSRPCFFLAASEITAALLTAVGEWSADVVLIAMSDGRWGCPRQLREALRAASIWGREGKGVPVVCSVGDVHSEDTGTVGLGADDLAAQPWTLGIASCDDLGRWLRRGAPMNQLGPSVFVTAQGEVGSAGPKLPDDSSLASATVAGTIALLLRRHPQLTLAELRVLIAETSDIPPVVDALEADVREPDATALSDSNGWDRSWHNFKLGRGVLNCEHALAAAQDPVALAISLTKPTPAAVSMTIADGEPTGPRASSTRLLQVWRDLLAAQSHRRFIAEYLSVRHQILRIALHSATLREALLWLARHSRALAGAEEPRVAWLSSHDHKALAVRVRCVGELLTDSESLRREIPTCVADACLTEAVKAWAEQLSSLSDEAIAFSFRFWLECAATPTNADPSALPVPVANWVGFVRDLPDSMAAQVVAAWSKQFPHLDLSLGVADAVINWRRFMDEVPTSTVLSAYQAWTQAFDLMRAKLTGDVDS